MRTFEFPRREDSRLRPATTNLSGNANHRCRQDRSLVRQISEPVAVRYAWADNPVGNVQSDAGLPLTPFRTDDWPMVTAHNN